MPNLFGRLINRLRIIRDRNTAGTLTPGPRPPVAPTPTRQAGTPLVIPYTIQTEAASPDLKFVYVVSDTKLSTTSGQVLARWDMTTGLETHRLDLGSYTHQVSTFVRLAVHPSNPNRIFVVFDQVNSPSTSAPLTVQYQLMMLEVNEANLSVVNSLPFGPLAFQTPTGSMSENPQKVRQLLLSSSGDAAFTFGMYPKVTDGATEGSVARTDIQNWTHKGQSFIQDIVKTSGVLAANAAIMWIYTNPRACWVPGTNRVLLNGFIPNQGIGGVLEASLDTTFGLVPIRTLTNLNGYGLISWVGSKLYVAKIGNLQSVDQSQIAAAPVHHLTFPTIQYVDSSGLNRNYQYASSSQAAIPQQNRIVFGGSDGVWVFKTDANVGLPVDSSMILRGVPSKKVERVLAGNVAGTVLLRIRETTSNAAGGYKDFFTEYQVL